MKKKTIILSSVGVLTLGAISAAVIADGRGCGFKGGHHGAMTMFSDHKIEHLSRKLDLDDAQRDQLFAAIDENRPEIRELKQEMRATRLAMHELDPKDPDYQTKVGALAKTAGELATRVTLKMGEMRGEFAEVLTDEQLEKMNSLRERRHRRGGDHDSQES